MSKEHDDQVEEKDRLLPDLTEGDEIYSKGY